MRTSRPVRLSLYLAILVCIALAQLSVRSSVGAPAGLAHTFTGSIRLHQNFYSRYLNNSRDLIVYLPPGYDSAPERRYPVLYMQDGQNIFDEATSFFFAKERHMDEIAQDLIQRHQIEPLIIVGIYSVPYDRINEYTPTKPRGSNIGGHADNYGRMLVEEIKPFIDEHYRTIKKRSDTALGGSSLGGLAVAYLGFKYSKVFGKLSVMSPAAYWDDDMIVKYVDSLRSKPNQRICLTIGTSEPDLFLKPTRALHEALIEKGWKPGRDFGYLEADGLQHPPSEAGQRVHYMLRFLFPAK